MAYIYDGRYGQYRVLEERIGEGTYCVVDKVQSPSGNAVYAAKVLDPTKLDRLPPEGRLVAFNRFRDEILSLHELYMTPHMRHPHIIAVVDYGIPEHYMAGHCFGIVEFADRDLAGQIEFERLGVARRLMGRFSGKVSFAVGDKLRQFRGLASALAALHAMEVVHRDFKPQNILVVGDTLKLADMGLAEEVTGHGAARAGTPRYSAPEFFQRFYSGSVHSGSDVFSWATVFYEFLTGRYPFEALDTDTAIARLQQKIYSALATVAVSGASKELRTRLDDEIFTKCFSPTPEIRPTAAELVDSLDAIVAAGT